MEAARSIVSDISETSHVTAGTGGPRVAHPTADPSTGSPKSPRIRQRKPRKLIDCEKLFDQESNLTFARSFYDEDDKEDSLLRELADLMTPKAGKGH
jgi:hypothetical protein